VAALKIEGRMKSPEYVASVVSVYRAALDRAMAATSGFEVLPAETERLEEAFNRGFTQGCLADVRDDRMMSYTRPNNRGVPLGRVSGTAPGRATIALDRSLESGDTVEFWTATGRFAQAAGELGLDAGSVSAAPAGARVTIAVEHAVRPGDRVFRVVNAALTEAARRSWQSPEERRPVLVRIGVSLRVGDPARLEMATSEATVSISGPVVERARTKPVTPDEVVEHVGRLGGTPYRAEDVSVRVDADAGLGFSMLHRLRAEAVRLLDERRLAPWAERAMPSSPEPPALALAPRARRPARPELVAAVLTRAAADACSNAGADRVLLGCAVHSGIPTGHDALLPRVVHEAQVASALSCAGSSDGAAVAGNLGVLARLGSEGRAVEADWGLNVVNPWTAAAFAELGATGVWASPELSGRQLASVVAGSPVPVGVVAAGRLELMVAEHCVLQAAGECDHRCAGCARRAGVWVLRDRKGYEMPVTTDADGRAHIYNAVPLDLSRALPELLSSGVSAIRLDLQSSDVEDAARVTRAWRVRLDAALKGSPVPETPVSEPSTSAHFFRGLR
jgi:putative protease